MLEAIAIVKTRVQHYRERKFWSIRHLAALSGVHANTIVDIEKNRRRPREDTMQKLAKALNVTLDDLAEDDVA